MRVNVITPANVVSENDDKKRATFSAVSLDRQKLARLQNAIALLQEEADKTRSRMAALGPGYEMPKGSSVLWGGKHVALRVGTHEFRFARMPGSGVFLYEMWKGAKGVQMFVEGGEMFADGKCIGVLFGAVLDLSISGAAWRHVILTQTVAKVPFRPCRQYFIYARTTRTLFRASSPSLTVPGAHARFPNSSRRCSAFCPS
jgi:hypothetical protein